MYVIQYRDRVPYILKSRSVVRFTTVAAFFIWVSRHFDWKSRLSFANWLISMRLIATITCIAILLCCIVLWWLLSPLLWRSGDLERYDNEIASLDYLNGGVPMVPGTLFESVLRGFETHQGSGFGAHRAAMRPHTIRALCTFEDHRGVHTCLQLRIEILLYSGRSSVIYKMKAACTHTSGFSSQAEYLWGWLWLVPNIKGAASSDMVGLKSPPNNRENPSWSLTQKKTRCSRFQLHDEHQ